jgi:hypothetical protein
MPKREAWIERMVGTLTQGSVRGSCHSATPGLEFLHFGYAYLELHAPKGQKWRVAWGKAKRRPGSASNVFSKQPRQRRSYDALDPYESAFPFDFCH